MFQLVSIDSATYSQQKRREGEIFQQTYPDEKERYYAALRKTGEQQAKNRYQSIPILGFKCRYLRYHKGDILSSEEYINYYIDKISFDIDVLDSTLIHYYLRDDEELTIWSFDYPPAGELPQKDGWRELITYTKREQPDKREGQKPYRLLPGGDKTQLSSVSDESFFTGHFKVIRQDKQLFIINLNHGAVYHLGPEKIEKVAQLQPVPEERTIRGRRLFIEDRDNGELIFFAPVSLLGPRERLPKMRLILTREAFEEAFGKVE
jgi:hypothetical protein